MNVKSLLCAGMLVSAGLSASAYNLISPEEGVVNEVSSLAKVQLLWDSDVQDPPSGEVQLLDESGKLVVVGNGDFDWDNWSAYIIKFNPAPTQSGMYTMVVPANMASDNSNKEYRIQYKLEAQSETAVPTAVSPESGSSIVQGEGVSFDMIQITFGGASAMTVNEANISLTDQTGTPVEFTIGGWYSADDPMLEWAENGPFVNIMFNEKGQMPSGTYTLKCNPGAFTTASGVMLETPLEYTYTYTKTIADADPTPLEITSALLGIANAHSEGIDTSKYTYTWDGTDAKTITPDMPLAEVVGTNGPNNTYVPGTGVLVTFNHGEKAGYVTAELREIGTSEMLYLSEPKKQEDNSWLLCWPMTIRLYEGKNYEIYFRTYSSEAEMVEFGDGAALTFVGTSEPFKYSSAQYVTVVPTSGETLNSLNENKCTVLFTEPVTVEAVVNTGFGSSTPAECESANYEEYSNVWYVYIPESIMKGYPQCDISLVAYGEDGNIVDDGNNAEENSFLQFSYNLTLCQPRVKLRETNSSVSEINTFRAYSGKGNAFNTSWLAYPYVIDENGNIVANLNMEYATDEFGDKTPFKVVSYDSGSEWERNPLELEFQMIPAITKKGKYTLVLPTAAFQFGTQFDGETSVEQNFEFNIVDFYPITFAVDNCAVALSPVETGATSKLSLDIAEGWQLESLTLNGNDVTTDVVNGRYESAPVVAAVNYAATFSYDGVVVTPTGVNDVVTDLNLRGWSDGGKLYVSGLKFGQTVNVYTVGGAVMASAVVENDETLVFSLAEGTYIITVTDGDQRVALKLINK